MKIILSTVFLFITFLLSAHPGIGIVMDSKGNVFYTDLVHVWQITPDGEHQIALKNVHTHQLFLDENGHLYGEHSWYEGEATDKWGVKVNRVELQEVNPPLDIRNAMEKQMRAEREKRAVIAESEGEKQAKINVAEGSKQQAIKESEGEMQKRINEATGRASEIEQVAMATANGIRAIALAINEKGGKDAVNLRIAEQYLLEFGKLAKESNTMIMPSNLTDISSIIATATKVFDATKE